MNTHLKIIGTLSVISLTLFGCGLPPPIQPPDEPLAIDSPTLKPPAENSTTEDLIKELFSKKYDKPISEITINISAQDETHVRGGVSFSPGGSENGGMFLAVKENNQWKLVYDGNGAAPCKELGEYGFTQDFLKGICDLEPATKTPAETMTVKVYYIDTNVPNQNGSVGCGDEAVGIDKPIVPTASLLETALEILLSSGQSLMEGAGLYNALANQNWELEDVSIINEEAIIKFSGKFVEMGACENPRIKAQIEKTALQFSTVKKVSIFVGGISLDELMSAKGETMAVKVYFNNPDIDPNWDTECDNVFAVEREIPLTRSVALATMAELLKGPTDAEENNGYITNINPGVKVQSLTIENGVAKIDFDERLEYQVGGSCKTSAIIAQIKQTLKQFSTIKDVVISINGETEAILQP
jgi:spore germination protein GerM